MPISAAQVVGANARKLRLDAGASLEDVAKAAKFCGLRWTTGRVGDFENGRFSDSFTTLYAAAAALAEVIGRPVALAELFAGEGPLAVTDRLEPDLERIREALAGEPVEGTFGDMPADEQERVMAGIRKASSTEGWPKHLAKRPAGPTRNVLRDFAEADQKMCKNLGVSHLLGAAAMAALWARTFRAERDHRAGPDANAQRRGQISRQLKAELLGEIGQRD